MADGGITEVKVLEAHAAHVFRTSLHGLLDVLDDPAVQEIMLNRPDEVWIDRAGQMIRLDRHISETAISSAIRALASANSRDVKAVLDCRMPGYRIAAVLPPVGIKGPAICIRKHARSLRSLDDYAEQLGPPTPAAGEAGRPDPALVAQGGQALMDYFRWVVRARKNIAIVGGTGSGKTTFLNALLREVQPEHRVLTIEDTAELQVTVPNHVCLEALSEVGVDIRALVRMALRFRPDRIIVGEVRGAEAYDLLDALNTGHSGGACSLHANSPEMGLARLANMVRMSPSASNVPDAVLCRQIADAINVVIYCEHRGLRRGPVKVIEVLGADEQGFLTRTMYDNRGE